MVLEGTMDFIIIIIIIIIIINSRLMSLYENECVVVFMFY